jgi:hypothetical protein
MRIPTLDPGTTMSLSFNPGGSDFGAAISESSLP